MTDIKQKLKAVGAYVPRILLPAKNVDDGKFSVIACDQFSAQPDYWNDVKSFVGESPSALNIILPEAFLSSESDETVNEINDVMRAYNAKPRRA